MTLYDDFTLRKVLITVTCLFSKTSEFLKLKSDAFDRITFMKIINLWKHYQFQSAKDYYMYLLILYYWHNNGKNKIDISTKMV